MLISYVFISKVLEYYTSITFASKGEANPSGARSGLP